MPAGWVEKAAARSGLVNEAEGVGFPGGEEQGFREEIREKNRRLRKLRERLEEKDREIAALRAKLDEGDAEAGLKPENIVWIFGNGRSGTSWLAQMVGEAGNGAVWDEPLVGLLFGDFYYLREGEKRGAKFVMGPRYKDVWLRNIRDMVLDGAAIRHADIPEGGRLVVKEPHGSVGAPLLAEALPESGVILLVRDPRDVVASYFDAFRDDSWASGILFLGERDRRVKPDLDPDAYVEERANVYLRDVTKAKEAYDTHQGRKVLVRYEDLRADALGTMARLCPELGIELDEEDLARVVEAHSWEAVPREERGEGKFRRKARPGSWKEDLTPGQARVVEETTAPLLDEFYPGWR